MFICVIVTGYSSCTFNIVPTVCVALPINQHLTDALLSIVIVICLLKRQFSIIML